MLVKSINQKSVGVYICKKLKNRLREKENIEIFRNNITPPSVKLRVFFFSQLLTIHTFVINFITSLYDDVSITRITYNATIFTLLSYFPLPFLHFFQPLSFAFFSLFLQPFLSLYFFYVYSFSFAFLSEFQ